MRGPPLPSGYNPLMRTDKPIHAIRHSACPHDCPSTCALEVEPLDDFRIGKVRGAAANSYTAGADSALG